jgi:hypothetical protein
MHDHCLPGYALKSPASLAQETSAFRCIGNVAAVQLLSSNSNFWQR